MNQRRQNNDHGGTSLEESRNQTRRAVLKKMALSGGIAAGAVALPSKWTKPIVDRVMVPVHAQTSSAPVRSKWYTSEATKGQASTETGYIYDPVIVELRGEKLTIMTFDPIPIPELKTADKSRRDYYMISAEVNVDDIPTEGRFELAEKGPNCQDSIYKPRYKIESFSKDLIEMALGEKVGSNEIFRKRTLALVKGKPEFPELRNCRFWED